MTQLKTEIREVKLSLQTHLGKNSRLLEQQLEQLSKKYNVEYLSQQTHRTLRLNDAIDVCQDILSLSEGNDFD